MKQKLFYCFISLFVIGVTVALIVLISQNKISAERINSYLQNSCDLLRSHPRLRFFKYKSEYLQMGLSICLNPPCDCLRARQLHYNQARHFFFC